MQAYAHLALYAEIALLARLDALSGLVVRRWHGRFHEVATERSARALPLRASDDALRLPWGELTTVHEKTGEVLFHNSFITDWAITDKSVVATVRAARAHGKSENEHHRTRKQQGDHLEHNFGHRSHYRSMILLLLKLLAFLSPTLLELRRLAIVSRGIYPCKKIPSIWDAPKRLRRARKLSASYVTIGILSIWTTS